MTGQSLCLIGCAHYLRQIQKTGLEILMPGASSFGNLVTC